MSKYINIIIFTLFGVLSIKLNIGLSLYIPIIYYYIYKKENNLILLLPITFLSSVLFKINNYLILVILYIPLILLYFIKNNRKIYLLISLSITNIITYYIYKFSNNIIGNIYIDILAILICPLLFILMINNEKIDYNRKINNTSFVYNELVQVLILILGSSQFKIYDISIGLIIGIYYAMYFSSNKYKIISIIFSIVISIILKMMFNIEYAYIIIIISLIYYIPNIFSSIICITLCIYFLLLYKDILPINIYYAIAIVVMIFELSRFHLVNKSHKKETITNIYETTINQVDNELTAFSLFLDKINRNIDDNKYDQKINEKIQTIINEVCFSCSRRVECFERNKGKLYYFYRSSILEKDTDFICENGDKVRRYGRVFNNTSIKESKTNSLLKPLINGVSSIIKQYTINNSKKEELEINNLYSLREELSNYGYSISLFNVLKTYKNDFVIEVGIIGITFSIEKEVIEKIASQYLKAESTVNKQSIKGSKTYVLIIPKINYDITYGYGSVTKVGNVVCGDNYLIKNNSNKNFIGVICDGMGKGLNANVISKNTLQLIDEITNTNIESETALHILNTLYYIHEYQDIYTTVDFIDIDKHNGEMVLYKAGATFTYIIHENNTIEKIENDNLPFGLNEMVIVKKFNLNDNDLIILASDGIFENIVNEKEFEDFLINIKKIEPQKIAYEILNYARNTDVISKDDMSVIVIKVKAV